MTERVRALLDLDHLRVIEELTAARRRGGGETFREELFSRLGSSCPVPAYVLWAEREELFTLPAMREVYRALRSAGHLHMALEVLTRIAQRTEEESDQTAVQQLDEEAAALLRGVELQEPGEDGGFTETILVVEDAESLARQEKDLADLPSRLTAQGYDVVLGLMGVEEVPPQWESSRVRHLSLPAPSGLSSRREALGSSFDELLGELRPSLVLLRLSALEAPHLSEKARARRVPTAWDLRADELRRRKQRRPGHCAAHPSRMDEALEQDFLTAASRASVLLARDQRWAEELAGQGADSVRAVASAEELLGHLLEVSRMGPQERRSTDRSRYSVSVEQAEQWAATLRENPVKDPYQWFHARAAQDQDVMRDGWVYAEFDPVTITPDMDWDSAAAADRSWCFRLHAWEFMDPVVRQYQKDESGPQLDWCVDIAASWSRAHLGETPASSMAWYDMALSWRSPRLASLLHLAVAAEVPAGRLVPLFELVLAHVDAHFAKDSFAVHNNHGFYAALGQLVLVRYLPELPRMNALRASGEERMEVMATSQFLSDGGHSEHSPDYHRMLLGSFEQAIAQGLIQGASVMERIQKASEALGWFVQPNGGMLQFGDSPKRKMVNRRSMVQSETSRFILTDGRDGVPQEQELFMLPETGYAIVRSPQPQAAGELATGSYLALAAGFHSRAHKHCDDLSLVWTHRGREILVDGGRYGYGPQLPKDSPLRGEGFFYAAPERQYVESVVAHNTAALDGKNHDRRRPPYGSALQRAVEEDGAYVIEASAPHTGWHHDRRLRFAPSGELLIEDTITAEDEEEHTYSLYFNIDGSWNLDESCGSGLRLSGEDSPGVAVSWAGAPGELRVARGEKDPLRGWRSKVDRQLEEAWSVERTGVFRGSVTVQTIFTVQDPPQEVPNMRTVLTDTPGHKITFHPGRGRGNLLLVTFGTMQSGLTEEGFGTDFAAKHGYDHVYVAQKPGSWYQELSLEELQQALGPLAAQYQRVVAYGSSLGAYAALYYSGVLNAQALASAPINWAHPDLKSTSPATGAGVEFVHRTMVETPRSTHPPVILYDPRRESDRNFIDTYVAPAEPDLIRREVPYTGHAVLVAMRVHSVLDDFLLAFLDEGEVREIDLPEEGNYIWHCYYGEELSRLGEEEKAEEHLRRSLELEFNKGAALHLSRLLHRTGQVEERERLREQTEAELGDASFMDRRSVAD